MLRPEHLPYYAIHHTRQIPAQRPAKRRLPQKTDEKYWVFWASPRPDDDPLLPQKGTGLGLPLARMMAELHGGTLSIESAIGFGTTVTVALPPGRTRPRAAVA